MKMRRHQADKRIVGALLGACALWVTGVALDARQKAKAEDFSGTWQLNEGASTNPGGPATGARPTAAGAKTGGAASGDKSGGGNSNDKTTSGLTGKTASAVDTQFSPEEQARTRAELRLMQAVPQKLTVQATDKTLDLTFEGGGSSSAPTFKNVVGKKDKITAIPTFEKAGIQAKVSWSNGMFKRELTTPDSLTVNEEYSLSADGKQLTVTLAAKSVMMRLSDAENPPIKRVYDRQ